jgi:hypothetical protein
MTKPLVYSLNCGNPNTRFIFDLEIRSDKANNSTNSTYDPRKRGQVLNWACDWLSYPLLNMI